MVRHDGQGPIRIAQHGEQLTATGIKMRKNNAKNLLRQGETCRGSAAAAGAGALLQLRQQGIRVMAYASELEFIYIGAQQGAQALRSDAE